MKHHYLKRFLAISLGLLVASSALAQYVWLDEHGVKQFSDVPPPGNVPQNRILKQPHRTTADQPAPATADDAKKDGASTDKAPMTTAEKNADFNKRKQEKEAKEKKAEEEATRQAQNEANCKNARNYLNTLKSGIRISSTDDNGQRSYMSDADRAQEQQKAQEAVDNCNNSK